MYGTGWDILMLLRESIRDESLQDRSYGYMDHIQDERGNERNTRRGTWIQGIPILFMPASGNIQHGRE